MLEKNNLGSAGGMVSMSLKCRFQKTKSLSDKGIISGASTLPADSICQVVKGCCSWNKIISDKLPPDIYKKRGDVGETNNFNRRYQEHKISKRNYLLNKFVKQPIHTPYFSWIRTGASICRIKLEKEIVSLEAAGVWINFRDVGDKVVFVVVLISFDIHDSSLLES